MIRNRAILATAVAALLLGNVNLVCAQNPLRADQERQPLNSSGHKSILSRILNSPEDGAFIELEQPHRLPPPVDELTQPRTHFDTNVLPASHLTSPESEHEDTNYLEAPSKAANFIEREYASQGTRDQSGAQPGPQNLGLLISKIGMNLAFVLSLAIGFVLIAKRWMKSKQPSVRVSQNSDGLHVKEVLILDSKTTLRLVQWRTNRILVACDAEGIKSVNILNPTFDQTLDELSENLSPPVAIEPVSNRAHTKSGIDENLLRRLLENAQAQQAQSYDANQRRAA